MRIAAIDIGTNSIHVVIAQALPEGGFEVLDREREVVQVGRGSFATGRLRADAAEWAGECAPALQFQGFSPLWAS